MPKNPESSKGRTVPSNRSTNHNQLEFPLASAGRRRVLKSLATAAFGALSPAFARAGGNLSGESPAASGEVKNPSWYGFNLLEYFSTDPDWMKYFPYKNDGMFREDDFRWMRDWGFNFVRLPMDYRFWTHSDDLMKIDEKKVEPIDRAIRLGEKYGIHVSICLHRAPGDCILDGMDERLTGIHITEEKTSVYTDSRALEAFLHQWSFFAQRYHGLPSPRLSFNLVNEPMARFTKAELAELAGEKPDSDRRREAHRKHELQYIRVARAAIEAIRSHDPDRWIISDGYDGGVAALPDLADTRILQSCHTYYPAPLTHYQCEWARGFVPLSAPTPTWPLKDDAGKVIDRAAVANLFRPWRSLCERGVRIHFGEMGCYKHTPPEVVLAWFNDTLDVIGDLGSGWALWNFRGPFGILDTERAGTKYEDWHGHPLDRPLLDLLQKKMRKTTGGA